MDVLIYEGDFMAKPRMVRSDKYKKRKVTSRYWAFKALLVIAAKKQKFVLGDNVIMEFQIAMPKSWSKKKKEKMYGTPHQQRPDLDNFIKTIGDCLKAEDSTIYHIEATKIWAAKNKIQIKNL